VVSARLLVSAEPLKYTQNEERLVFHDLPVTPPDEPATVIEAECDGEPAQVNRLAIRGRARGSA